MSNCPDRAPSEGEAHVNVGTSASNNKNIDRTNTPYSSKAEAMIAAMDLNSYESSYDCYALFQPTKITGDDVTSVTCPPKTYSEAAQGYPPSTPDTDGRSTE